MKRLIISIALVIFLSWGYYRYTDGVLIYTYLWQWPGIWTLVNVEPA